MRIVLHVPVAWMEVALGAVKETMVGQLYISCRFVCVSGEAWGNKDEVDTGMRSRAGAW